MRRFFLLLIASWLLPTLALASTISGTVFGTAASVPLSEAEIWVNADLVTKSDLSGKFVLRNLKAGDLVRIKKTDYVSLAALAGATDETLRFGLANIWEITEISKIYTDTPDTAWWSGPVRQLYEQQVLSIATQGQYRPADPLTRAELAALLVRTAGLRTNAVQATDFCDVAPGDWFAPAVQLLRGQSWIGGYDSTSCEKGKEFRPHQAVNRAEAVQMLLGTLERVVAAKLKTTACLPSSFSDVPESAWFGTAVRNANCLGLITGYPDNSFRPSQTINRAEIAAVLARVLEKLL